MWLLIIDDVEGIFGDETTPVIDVPNHTSWVGDKRMTQMSANDEQNSDDVKNDLRSSENQTPRLCPAIY